jgi:hypothetical protein
MLVRPSYERTRRLFDHRTTIVRCSYDHRRWSYEHRDHCTTIVQSSYIHFKYQVFLSPVKAKKRVHDSDEDEDDDARPREKAKSRFAAPSAPSRTTLPWKQYGYNVPCYNASNTAEQKNKMTPSGQLAVKAYVRPALSFCLFTGPFVGEKCIERGRRRELLS